MPLQPKSPLVVHPKGLRPIALVPVLRNLLGSIVLAKTGSLLQDTGLWQFAYKKGFQVIDLVLLISLMGQKCMEWSIPFFLGVTDIPKCFDEVQHQYMLEALLQRGVQASIAAWFVREVRACVLHLHLGSVEVDPITVCTGIPQGTKYGPRLCTSVMHTCVQPVWETCQADGLGFRLDGGLFIPFAFFCDNIFIFAHSAKDFLEIASRLKAALGRAGWRLPDDRMEYQSNRFVLETDLPALEHFVRLPLGSSFKVLGCKMSVAGTSHADATFKKHICASALESRANLWKCPGVSRKNKISLMQKVACSSFCWCVGSWTVTRRQLISIRAVFARQAKRALRLPRYWGDSDEVYHRRANKVLRLTLHESRILPIDAYILKRMYDYAGHLVRVSARDPQHLTGAVLGFMDAQFKDALTAVIGHQGHNGRFSPWNWERQYHSFFNRKGMSWKDVAKDREEWQKHRDDWIESMRGGRAAASNDMSLAM